MVAPINWDKCGNDAHCEALQCFTESQAYVLCSEDGETVSIEAPVCMTLSSVDGSLDDQNYTEIYDCYQAFVVRVEEWRASGLLSDCPEREWWIYVPCTEKYYKIGPEDGLPPYQSYDRYCKKWTIHTKQMVPCFTWEPPSE